MIPLRAALPTSVAARRSFFAEHGWQVKELCYYGDEGIRRNRPYQLPWWMKLMFLFGSRKRREALRQAAGFAVLVPKD